MHIPSLRLQLLFHKDLKMNSLWERVTDFRKRMRLPCPGSYENLHKDIKGVLPTLHTIDGAKVDLTSMLSPSFQVTHSFAWASQHYPPTYHFGAGYVGRQSFLHGQVDSDGNLQARANYSWLQPSAEPTPKPATQSEQSQTPLPPPQEKVSPSPQQPAALPPPSRQSSSTTKMQAQFNTMQTMLQVEHDHVGSDWSVNLKAINSNPIDLPPSYLPPPPKGKTHPSSITGVFVAQYLQSITQSFALGGEYVLQRPSPDIEESAITLAMRYAPPSSTPVLSPPVLPPGFPSPYQPVNPSEPVEVLSATYQPSSGLLHTSYYRRINQRLEVAAELQLMVTMGSTRSEGMRNGLASVGFKMDTVFATVRGMIDTSGKVSTVIEERLAQGLSFQISGEMDYYKGQGGAGRVGVGFSLEA
ncbi:hypothetical protein SeMB42_g01426 [Synchytrium endobioticum]|uniref:Mitochondrial distribution and morphology protein 10 n=1 Tax=Synchytrium endobioticum TaxID=286115 RepID=A0A507DMK7_9FUNG|nr:hypothetical protein SeLEV6574_g00535 [Synchytrium endobioticum]TPX52427.1 hypothetical protein SeMB42_g01426 [Synchytrium endobioticum]